MSEFSGLLHSCIGYDVSDPKRAVFRAGLPGGLPPGAECVLRDSTGSERLRVPFVSWGKTWGDHWWVADFSEWTTPGTYAIETSLHSHAAAPISIGEDLLWSETWRTVGLDQLDRRVEFAPDRLGWQDCGCVIGKAKRTLREVMSHAAMVIGLTDVLEFRGGELAADERGRVVAAALHGCEYLAACQDQARGDGYAEGALLHELDGYRYPIPGEMPKAAVAFARAARLAASDAAQRAALLDRASRCLGWYRDHRFVVRESVHSRAFGAGADFVPPEEPPTCDLLMAAWGAWELCKAGQRSARSAAMNWMEEVLARQLPEEEQEHGLYGHFRAFDSLSFTEKAWGHHGFGYNCGLLFAHYLLPLVEMCRDETDSVLRARWQEALRKFAYGYFLPACESSPFLLLPQGVFGDEGLLHFSGMGHGMNAAYAWAAALALEFEAFFADAAFRRIATGNLQWIAGLNAGVTREAMEGCWHYRREVPAGAAVPFSMIRDLGSISGGSWLDIPGSICNGFCADKQFTFELEPRRETDAPRLLTDEDWITHAGAWLSATSRTKSLS